MSGAGGRGAWQKIAWVEDPAARRFSENRQGRRYVGDFRITEVPEARNWGEFSINVAINSAKSPGQDDKFSSVQCTELEFAFDIYSDFCWKHASNVA